MQTRGEGVKKFENFALILIYFCSFAFMEQMTLAPIFSRNKSELNMIVVN